MAVKNIKLLESDINVDFKENEKENYIQALANMGQRSIIDSNKVEYDSFNFYNCFSDYINKTIINNDDYIGYIKYNSTNKCIFGITKRDEITKAPILPTIENSDLPFFILSNDIFKYHYFEEDFSFSDVCVNNISKISKNSIIKYDNGYVYMLLFGQLIGSDGNVEADTEIIYNKINIANNQLEYGLRLFQHSGYKGSKTNKPIYCLLEIDNTNSINNVGKFRIYKFDINEVETVFNSDIIDNFENYFYKDEYNKLSKYNILELLNNLDIANIDELSGSNTIFGLILQKDSYGNRIYQVGNDIHITSDTEDNYRLKIDEAEFNEYLDRYTFNIDKYGTPIRSRINYINNEIIYIIPRLLQEYSTYYNKNIYVLYQKILLSIYDYLLQEIDYKIGNEEIDNNNIPILYIPLNKNIYLFRNSINSFNIFNITNIFVNIINLDEYTKSIIYDNKILNNICFDNKVSDNKCKNFSIHINYNKNYKDIINNIEATVEYTLPYIDTLSYNWILNDNDSGISSSLNKTNNQFIFILLSKYDIETKAFDVQLLNDLPSSFGNIVYRRKEVVIDPYTLIGNQLNIAEGEIPTSLIGYAAVPVVEENISYLYQNSIIISIISSSSIITTNSSFEDLSFIEKLRNENDILFVTLWKYNDNLKDFELIKDHLGNPIDLSYLLNFNIAMSRLFNSKSCIFEYAGLLLNKQKYHTAYSSQDAIMLIYPDDINNDNDGNKLIVNLKAVATNKLSIDNNSLIKDTDVNSLVNDNNKKFINFKLDESTSNIVLKNNLLSTQTTELLVVDGIKTIQESNNSKINTNEEDYINQILNNDNSLASEVINTSLNDIIDSKESSLTDNRDYKFNISVPVIDSSEVLHSHNNFINRINVLSLNKDNLENYIIYNTFIGSELNINDKSTFTIKSSETNIDLGNKTLISQNDSTKFRKHDKFKVEFDEIELISNVFNINSFYDKIENTKYIKFGLKLYEKKFSLIGSSKSSLNNINNPVSGVVYSNFIYKLNNMASSYGYVYEYYATINKKIYVGFNLTNYILQNNNNKKCLEECNQIWQAMVNQNSNNSNIIEVKFVNQYKYLENPPLYLGYYSEDENKYVYLFIDKEYVEELTQIDDTYYLIKGYLNVEMIKYEYNNNNKYIFTVY